MKLRTFLLTALLPLSALAANITPGEPLPATTVMDKGELILNGDEITYQPWSSTQLPGKVRVVQHFAGRTSAKKINQPLMDAITAAKFPEEQYQTTNIVNVDDAIFGTKGFVRSSGDDSKREFSWSSIVLDENGAVLQSWDLEPKSSAIIVLDSDGKVVWFKEGELSEAEIAEVLGKLNSLLGS